MEKVDIDAVDNQPSPMGVHDVRKPVSTALGTDHFAMNYFELAPGESFSGGLHTHHDQEEGFYVEEGTVTFEVSKAVQEAKAGKVEFRVERAGIVHAQVGKRSFEAPQLADNVRALVGALVKAKPAAAKGTYLKSVTLSSTMGPGVKIEPSSITVEA